MPPRTTLAPGAPWPTQDEFIARIAFIKASEKKPSSYYVKEQPKTQQKVKKVKP